MSQITARIPEELLVELDAAVASLRRTRAEVIRQAVEYYLDDYEDIRAAKALSRIDRVHPGEVGGPGPDEG